MVRCNLKLVCVSRNDNDRTEPVLLDKHVHRRDGLADINVKQKSLPGLEHKSTMGMVERRKWSGLVCASYLRRS